MSWLNSLAAEMRAHGLLPTDDLIVDGEIHRFMVDGEKPGTRNGWYSIHDYPVPVANFGSWRTGERHTWRDQCEASRGGERESMRQRIERDRQRRESDRATARQAAAARAAELWAKVRKPALANPYLRGKAVGIYGIKQLGKLLVVPMRDIDGKLHSLQFIDPAGVKNFLNGGRTRGLFHVIGERTPRVWLAEGYATACSLYEDRNECVIVAFNAGNLMVVATEITKAWAPVHLVVMADDDWRTPGNPGITAAKAVAEKLGAKWHYPEFPPNRPAWATDYNDAARLWATSRASA